MKDTVSRKYSTYGAVSFGLTRERCGKSLSYSVFAKLDEGMITWIKSITDLN